MGQDRASPSYWEPSVGRSNGPRCTRDGATAAPAGHRGSPVSHRRGWLGGGGGGRLGGTPSTCPLSTRPTVSVTRERSPGLPLSERKRDEPPTVRCGSSPEHGLRELETTLGDSDGAPHRCPAGRGSSGSGIAARPESRFLAWGIGRSALRWLPQPVYAWRSGTLSATPRLPRIGGPLSTARGFSTVLRARSPVRVRDVVCPSSHVDHVHAAAGHLFAAGNWSHSPWRFQVSWVGSQSHA